MNNPVVSAIKRVKDAVVSITASKEIPAEAFEHLKESDGLPFSPKLPAEEALPHEHERMQVGGGSGFLVAPEGLILTNKHVVRDATATYTVVLANGKVLAAQVFSRDPINDIAVLKIEGEDAFPVSPLGDSSKLELGETLIAIGNALGTFQNTVSVGVVSGLSRHLSAEDTGDEDVSYFRGLIQTDAAINPGNSGGPLVNIQGEAIGINVATIMGAENIGFAIPIDAARRDLETIKKYGRIRKAFLGVHYIPIDEELATKLHLSGSSGALLLRKELSQDQAVLPGSPGEKAGLKEHDLVVEFNGKRLDTETSLQEVLDECEIGDEVPVVFMRDGKEQRTSAVLEERM